jgi:hypothetical protein
MLIYAVAVLITIAWIIESFTVGRGFVSTYLAPIAIAGLLVVAFLRDNNSGKGCGQ